MAKEEITRKIIKNGRGSYYVNVPKKMMKKLKWKERQKVVVANTLTKLIISDWKK